MGPRSGGWSGRILRVHVGDRKTQNIPTKQYADVFLGGLGLGLKVAWDEIGPEIGAFDAGNKLIFATGPLTGTLAPGSGRMEIVGKSPRTYPKETVTRSGMGGHWGVELKRAGYDALILEGRSERPVYLLISGEKIDILDADDLWGQDTFSTQQQLKKKHGNHTQIICIGPAGEHRSRIATIVSETSFSSGKSGFGAVMGAKNVKAIAVDGSGGRIPVAHPGRLVQLSAHYRDLIGYNPMREWTVGYCPPDDHARFFEKYRTGNASCFACPLQCFAFIKVPGLDPSQVHCINYYYMKPAYALHGETLEGDQAIWQSVLLCNKLGLCTFEMAGIVPWMKDLYAAGVIDEKKSGLPLGRIGSREFIEALLDAVAYRKDLGAVLAEGAPRAAGMLPGAWPLYEKYYPAHGQTEHDSVRDFPAIALLWALDSRDPMIDHHAYRHLAVSRQRWPKPHQLPPEKARAVAKKIFGSETAIDHGTYEEKAAVVAYVQNRSAVINSLVLCDFLFPIFTSQSREDRMGDTAAESKLLAAVTGIETEEKELDRVGERVWNLQRAVMVREGRARREDTLHASYFRESKAARKEEKSSASVAIISGDHTRSIPQAAFEAAKDTYYAVRGWDAETGHPTLQTLTALGLKEIAGQLYGPQSS